MGAVLYQEGEHDERHIISYSSATLTPAEVKFHVNEIECLSVVTFVKKYSAFLADKPFILRTDSRALLWLNKYRDAKAKLTRWALLLQEYTFEIQHVPGRANELPDYLSRNPDKQANRAMIDEERLFIPDSQAQESADTQVEAHAIRAIGTTEIWEQCRRAQIGSRAIQRTKRKWAHIERYGPVTAAEDRFHDTYLVEGDLVYRVCEEGRRLMVPQSVLPAVISHFHDETHPGSKETTRQIAKLYFHRNLRRLVQHYVRNCTDCFRVKCQHPQPQAPMKAITPTQPFEILSIDTLGPYILSRRKNRYMIIVEDVFSKWVEARAFPQVDSATVIRYLEEEIFPRFGTPRAIISDNGTIFDSRKYHKFCEKNHVEIRHTAIHHQRANPVERRVQELKKVLRAIMLDKPENRWDEHVHKALFTLRNRRNEASGTTPADLVLGHALPAPGTWKLPRELLRTLPPPTRDERIVAAQENQARYQQQRYHSEDVPQVTFHPGDKVMVKVFIRKRDRFEPVWDGPYQILRRKTDTIYEVRRGERSADVHVDNLRRAPRGISPYDFQSDDENDDPHSEPSESSDSEAENGQAGPSHTPDPVLPLDESEVPDSNVRSESEDEQPEGQSIPRAKRRTHSPAGTSKVLAQQQTTTSAPLPKAPRTSASSDHQSLLTTPPTPPQPASNTCVTPAQPPPRRRRRRPARLVIVEDTDASPVRDKSASSAGEPSVACARKKSSRVTKKTSTKTK